MARTEKGTKDKNALWDRVRLAAMQNCRGRARAVLAQFVNSAGQCCPLNSALGCHGCHFAYLSYTNDTSIQSVRVLKGLIKKY